MEKRLLCQACQLCLAHCGCPYFHASEHMPQWGFCLDCEMPKKQHYCTMCGGAMLGSQLVCATCYKKLQDMENEAMKLQDAPVQRKWRIITKSEPGCGKSIFAASFPNVLMIDLDKRIRSIYNFYVNGPKELRKTDIEYEQYDSFFQLDTRLEQLVGNCKYDTVVLSSVTRLVRMIMKTMIDMKGDQKGKKVGGIPVNTVEDYSGETGGLIKVIENLLRLPCHVILEAHVVVGKDIKTGLETRALLTGAAKLGTEIPGYFDEVYHFKREFDITGNPRYKFYPFGTQVDSGKTAFPNMPFEIDFTNANAYQILKGFAESGDDLKPKGVDPNDSPDNSTDGTGAQMEKSSPSPISGISGDLQVL